MKAINIESGKLVFGAAEKPSPAPGEVLIKVAAAGVNRADIYQRQGTYKAPVGASEILGLEVAGEIAALGEGVKNYAVGDKVCALLPGGGYAEYAVAPVEQVLPLPRGFDFIKGAAIPEAFFTAWYAIYTKCMLQKGETLLVHAGASGVGIAAVQLARALSSVPCEHLLKAKRSGDIYNSNSGSKVFATAGSREKCDFLQKIGAAKAINYREEDFAETLKDQGADVILDMVGGSYFQKNLNILKQHGRLVQIAFLGGAKAEINFAPLHSKSLTITSFRMRGLPVMAKAEIAKELRKKVWPLFESEKIIPAVDMVFPLSEAAAAHERMEANQNIGKIILKI